MKISPLVISIPLAVAGCAVAGLFVYKNMLAPSKAAEEKAPEVVREYVRFKAENSLKKVASSSGFRTVNSATTSGAFGSTVPRGIVTPSISTPITLTSELNQIPSATGDGELIQIQKDIESL